MVAPAQAGAYRACRPSQTHVIGTSLRWCDGVFCGKGFWGLPTCRRHSIIHTDLLMFPIGSASGTQAYIKGAGAERGVKRPAPKYQLRKQHGINDVDNAV